MTTKPRLRISELSPPAVAALIAREGAERRKDRERSASLGEIVALRWLASVKPEGRA